MSHVRPHFAMLVLLVASLACGGGGAAPTEMPTHDGPATAQASTQVAYGVATAQAEAQAAETATQLAVLAQAAATAQSETAEAATSTALFAQTATPAHATEVAANKKATRVAATEQAMVAATEQAAPLEQLVKQLVSDGSLTRSEGAYYAIPDFYDNWAYLNYYDWLPTGLSPTDFVVRADTTWESASNTADWYSSGCGFVFREENPDNHYLIFLGLDGYVHLSDFRGGVFHLLGEEFYGKVDTPKGSAQVMLVVEGRVFKYFVNGERVLTRESSSMPEGRLNLTLISGTNKDFGTRCLMKNIEVWELK